MAWLADGQRPLCVAKAELDDEKSQVRLSKVGLEIFLYNLPAEKSPPKNILPKNHHRIKTNCFNNQHIL